MEGNTINLKKFSHIMNEDKYNFFNTDNDEFLTKYDKIRDLEIRKLKPKAGDWVNFRSEYGDVWHKIIDVHEPEDYYATIYYYDRVDSKSDKSKKSFTYFHKIRKISTVLPDDARCVDDETGSYSERHGNSSKISEIIKNQKSGIK